MKNVTENLEGDRKQSGIRPAISQVLRLLDEAGVEDIHAASLRILEGVGVHFAHPGALELLKRNGAEVDGELAYLPARMVERAIDSAPRRVTLYARDPRCNLYLGSGCVHFTNGFGATWVQDDRSSQNRSATLADLVSFTRLADALELVHFCLFSVVPQDIPPAKMDLVSTACVLQNTSKHVQLSLEGARWLDEVIRIAQIVVEPGVPLPISAGGVPHSPLQYSADVMEKFIRLAQMQIPCFIVCGAMAGATAPVTLAGLLALQNAEFLAGLVVHQLSNPGAPAVYGTFAGGFDMRQTKLALGGPETSLVTCATQQLADRYGIPLGYATGGVTDSAFSDEQAGLEKTYGVLSAALAGVEVIHDAISGLLGSAMGISAAQMIIDHELCASVTYFLSGIPLGEKNLAEAVIAEVGHGGSYLTSDHTAQNFRKSLYLTPMRIRHADQAEKQVDYIENARLKAARLLESHQPVPLSSAQLKAIQKILDEA